MLLPFAALALVSSACNSGPASTTQKPNPNALRLTKLRMTDNIPTSSAPQAKSQRIGPPPLLDNHTGNLGITPRSIAHHILPRQGKKSKKCGGSPGGSRSSFGGKQVCWSGRSRSRTEPVEGTARTAKPQEPREPNLTNLRNLSKEPNEMLLAIDVGNTNRPQGDCSYFSPVDYDILSLSTRT